MKWNLIGAFVRNDPFGTEIAFRKGLERIGETVNVFDPSRPDKNLSLDPYADATLIFKWLDPSPLRDMIRLGFGGKRIIYQVDDLRFPHIKEMMQKMRDTCDHALTFDEDGAKLARDYGYSSSRRLLLTADNTLYKKLPDVKKDIDVSFVGSLSHGPNHSSRVKMLKIVESLGVNLFVANELFDIGKINEVYNRSKIVLNHATDVGQPFGHGFGYQCRHFEAGFAGAFVFSNAIDNESSLKNIAVFHDEYGLKKGILNFLDPEQNEWRESTATALYDELYAHHKPEHRAADLVQFLKEIS